MGDHDHSTYSVCTKESLLRSDHSELPQPIDFVYTLGTAMTHKKVPLGLLVVSYWLKDVLYYLVSGILGLR